MRIHGMSILVVAAGLSGGVFAEYQGKGGMTKFDVASEAYVYHYENGFTDEDAMSWDPNLQFAWSRAGAAKTCDVAFDKEKVIDGLIVEYGDPSLKEDFMERFKHDMNGIEFHHLQSKKIEGFCTTERIKEVKSLIPDFEAGKFPKPF